MQNAFELHYQPQYDVSGRKLLCFEALLRLKDTQGKPISPGKFVPIAEKLGLINEIGRWVLMTACKTAATWPDNIAVAVNFAPDQIQGGKSSSLIREALWKTGLRPHKLHVEITEGTLLKDTQTVTAELSAIRALGCLIAMDDFGTGYSSLSYLSRFPIDKLKIDRTFIDELLTGREQAERLLETVIGLGHTLGMQVIAEGVETAEQATKLAELQCDQVQGFFFGRPMPALEVEKTIFLNQQEQKYPPLGRVIARTVKAA